MHGFGRGGGGHVGGGVGGGWGRGVVVDRPNCHSITKTGWHVPGRKMWRCGGCRAESFMHRDKCYKCMLPRPAPKNEQPKRSDLCKCGCQKVVNHGMCGIDVSFFDIPLEVFIPLIQSSLSITDICNLAQIDKCNNDYFSCNEIWNYFFVKEKIKRFIPEKLISLSKARVRMNDTMDWTPDEIRQNRCTLIIKNESNNIPIDIYWIPDNQSYKQMNKKGPIQPGKNFITTTYPNHKWMCMPTTEWLENNPCSNVGFKFCVNVLELTEFKFDKVKKLAYLRKFHEPRETKPVKGMGKKYKDVKKEYMKLVLNHEKLARIFVNNNGRKKRMTDEVARLQRQLRWHQNQLKLLQNKEKAIMWAQSVVKQK